MGKIERCAATHGLQSASRLLLVFNPTEALSTSSESQKSISREKGSKVPR
jgi:hypothetical protein